MKVGTTLLRNHEEDCKRTVKAAQINIVILTMDQMTSCNVKGVAHSNNPTGNYHRTPQFLSVPTGCFSVFQLTVLVLWLQLFLLSHQPLIQTKQVAVFSKIGLINPRYAAAKHQTADKVSNKLVSIVEHLGAKYFILGVGGDQIRA